MTEATTILPNRDIQPRTATDRSHPEAVRRVLDEIDSAHKRAEASQAARRFAEAAEHATVAARLYGWLDRFYSQGIQ